MLLTLSGRLYFGNYTIFNKLITNIFWNLELIKLVPIPVILLITLNLKNIEIKEKKILIFIVKFIKISGLIFFNLKKIWNRVRIFIIGL